MPTDATQPADPNQAWEYQVIHLNVEDDTPPPAPPAPAAGAPAAQAPVQPQPPAQPPFSKTYLEQEFPNFYQQPAQGNQPVPQHPAQQLQGFLNTLGEQGWQLIGVYPIGRLLMMFFKRPKPPSADPQLAGAPADAMAQVLERLEALEKRLGPSASD